MLCLTHPAVNFFGCSFLPPPFLSFFPSQISFMDFYRESSPPPAYSEQDYDKKIATAIELSLIAEEREEEDESRSEVAAVSSRARECASTRNYAAQINPPPSANPRSVRRLPAPPGAGVADNKPLRVHARSASHSYGSSPVSNPPKPRPKWHGDLAEDVSSTMTLSRITATSPHNRDHGSSSPPPAFSTVPPPPSSSHSPTVSRYTNSSSLPQHHFSGPKNDSTPLSHSFPSRNGSHTRAVSQLNFDSSVAYSRSGFSPVSAGSSHSDSSQNNTFNPNSFYK